MTSRHRTIWLIVTLGLGCFVAPLSVAAQQAPRTVRLAYCSLYRLHDPEVTVLLEALRQGLREHGYVEGQNLSLTFRFAEGRAERLPDLAHELVQLQPDLIIAGNTLAIRAIKNATSTIPIVMASTDDPVAAGLVASLAKPGGNVTGQSNMAPELNQKRLELLRQVAPRVTRVGVFRNPSNPATARGWEVTQAAATTLKIHLTSLEVRGPDEFAGTFRTAVRMRVQGLITVPDAVLFADRQRLVDFAREKRFPAVFWRREFVSAGGLLAYGPSFTELYRMVAVFVDKILKGAKPADLPVEQPTKFELAINLKTAKTLGLTIPQSVLLQADEVIR